MKKILSGFHFTVKVFPLDAPTVVVTTTATGPAETPLGTVHLMVVSDHGLQVATIPPNETVDEPWVKPKYLPRMITTVPTVPDVGKNEIMIGEA